MDGIDDLTTGDSVTAGQMRALFGCDLHPLAERRQQQLEGAGPHPTRLQDSARLGAPFKIVDGEVSPFRLEVTRPGRGLTKTDGEWSLALRRDDLEQRATTVYVAGSVCIECREHRRVRMANRS